MGTATLERIGLKLLFLTSLMALLTPLQVARAGETNAQSHTTVIVAVGAPGQEEFGEDFKKAAQLWSAACEKAGASNVVVGLDPTNEVSDLDKLQLALQTEPTNSVQELWLVFIGHGTFDGTEAKFNLRGPDLSATDLAAWLKPFHRRVAIIDCSSSSSPFINALSGPGRAIVTATRNGFEQNYTRFGTYMAGAITDPKADLDKDGETSLLEAFVAASRRVTEFYDAEGRLCSEHALLDDNGDGLAPKPEPVHQPIHP